MRTLIMTADDEITRLQSMVDQCHERITALQRELEKMRALHPENSCSDMYPKLKAQNYQLIEERRRYLDLLEIVRDAGRPHSHKCECEACEAYALVVGELSK